MFPRIYVANIHIRNLATSCTSPESSGPREAGAPRITCVGKQRLRVGEARQLGISRSAVPTLGILTEPFLSPTVLGAWAPDG